MPTLHTFIQQFPPGFGTLGFGLGFHGKALQMAYWIGKGD